MSTAVLNVKDEKVKHLEKMSQYKTYAKVDVTIFSLLIMV